jgi:CO/xanthine dehydrogenase Mo-binding subunit
MRPPALAYAAVLAVIPTLAHAETRCGWIDNPTPANWWLTDGTGEWIIATQGGAQAGGMDLMPDFTAGEWVETNGSYGYGCTCMEVATDKAEMRILKITGVTQKPLAACRSDKALPSRE